MKKFRIPAEDQFLKKISIAVLILIVLVFSGALFHSTQISGSQEHSFKESVYYTVALITHTDREEVSQSIFYIAVVLLGYVTQFYILYIILEFMLEGKLRNIFSEVKILNQIKHMKNHVIVCGGGRVGKNVALELKKYSVGHIILEADKERVDFLKKQGLQAITADALDENELEKAGIFKAGHLCACLGEDGDNILLVLSAKEQNPEINVTARATREKTANKLRHAGARHIVLPEVLGGMQLAHSLVRDARYGQ
ncbi:MAG: potassium channel family protein [Candidatus Nanoarchaeia archaeon]